MGIGEEGASFGESIEVGCLSLWVAAEASDPVVEVIDGDE